MEALVRVSSTIALPTDGDLSHTGCTVRYLPIDEAAHKHPCRRSERVRALRGARSLAVHGRW
eukprot:5194800-Prymnesium_polylepis.1